MRLSLAISWVLAATAAASAAGQTPSSAEAVARDLQHRYDTVRDFSADFVHAYQGGVLRQKVAERGHVLIKKPGKMRWEYTSPEPKLFVSDGRKLYSYIPQDKQVLVSTVPQDDQATTPALFLTGKGSLTQDFTSSFDKLDEAPADTVALKLTPKRREPEYEWLSLVVNPKTLRILMLITVDAQGGRSAFSFTNLKENTGLSDTPFTFQMPRGVDVVTDAPSR